MRDEADNSPVVAARHSWPRTLARPLVSTFARAGISANQVTVARLLVGVVACGMLAIGTRTAAVWAGFLWVVAMFFDRIDGELARSTGTTSTFGRRLDYASDLILTSAFFVGLGVGQGGLAIFMGLVAGMAVLITQMLAEAIDVSQAVHGEKAFPQVGGFDPEDSQVAFALVLWLGWERGFLAAASVGAPLFAALTWCRVVKASAGTRVTSAPATAPAARRRKGSLSSARWVLIAMLTAGFVGVGVFVGDIDFAQVWGQLRAMGIAGLCLLLLVYALRMAADALAWLFAFPALPINGRWLGRLCAVLWAGSILDKSAPMSGLGGAPMRAVVLKRFYGVGYTESTASLVLRRTMDVLALALFLPVALYCGASEQILGVIGPIGLIGGVVAIGLGAAFMVAAPRWRATERVRRRLKRGDDGDRVPGGVHRTFAAMQNVEGMLVTFYTSHPWRFLLAVVAAVGELAIGAGAVYLALYLLGHPVGFVDAVVIEGWVLFVTAAFFFVPANIGTQEGALMVICAGLFDAPTLGLALAAIRRARDVVWICISLAFGLFYVRAVPEDIEVSVPVGRQ